MTLDCFRRDTTTKFRTLISGVSYAVSFITINRVVNVTQSVRTVPRRGLATVDLIERALYSKTTLVYYRYGRFSKSIRPDEVCMFFLAPSYL